MIATLAYAVVQINAFFKDKKNIGIISAVLLWLLMGLGKGNVDYRSYEVWYNNYKTVSKELLYTFFERIFNGLHFEYPFFLLCMSGICMYIRYQFASRYTQNLSLVFALYALFPFALDSTQLRFFYASTVVYVGFHFLLSEEKLIIGGAKYFVMVIIATLIHTSSILFLVYLLVLIPWRKLLFFLSMTLTGIVVTGGYLKKLAVGIGIFGIGKKFVFANRNKANYYAYRFYSRALICVIVVSIVILLILLSENRTEEQNDENRRTLLNAALKINLISVLFIPIYRYAIDVHRVYYQVFFFFYVAIASTMKSPQKNAIIKSNVFKIMLVLIVAVIAWYLNIYSLYKKEVWFPLFQKNYING